MAEVLKETKLVLGTANFEALGVVEADGQLYLPTTIRRRDAKGNATETIEVLMTLATTEQRMRAKASARKLAKTYELDLDRDEAEIGELENYAILAYALRDKQTRAQLCESAKALFREYHDVSLKEVWFRYNHFSDLCDPRFGEIDDERLWTIIAEVASEGTILPLGGMPGFEQATSIVFMARLALTCPTVPSWLSSRMRSPSGPSTSRPSSESSEAESQGPSDGADVDGG